MLLGPGSRLDAYELLQLLGAGGMGEVWLATEVRLGRKVALKLLPPDLTRDAARVSRFEQEARAASALTHPNVCMILALGETSDGQHYIAMEYVAGETLRKRIAKSRLSIADALDTAIQIASALVAAHAAGIVHRDIKPENVIIRPDGLLKVVDFGLAKLTAVSESAALESTKTALRTETGSVVGTVAYMSPEQARGQQVDTRTDIWSLGVVLYEMVTGRNPFHGESTSDVLAGILEREPPPLPLTQLRTASELQRIVSKTLRKSREERYQGAQDLILDLRSLRVDVKERDVPDRADRNDRARLVAVAAAFCALLTLLGVGWWWGTRAVDEGVATAQAGQPTTRPMKRLTFGVGLQTDPAWSPDGRFLAYAADHTGNFDIWVQPVAGGTPLQVTRSPAQDHQPTWSPDGANIVFRSERDGGGIFVVSALGGSERRLATFGALPEWAPDGSQVLFSSTQRRAAPGSVPGLFVVGLDGRPPRRVAGNFTSGLHEMGAWSWYPDSQRVSIVGVTREGERGLFTVSIDGGAAQRSSNDTGRRLEQLDTGRGRARFDWSPSGDALFVEGLEGGMYDVWKVAVERESLRLVSAERLTTGGGLHRRLAISPDGGRMAVTSESEEVRLWSFQLTPSGLRDKAAGQPVTEQGAKTKTSDLSADGRLLVHELARHGSDRLELWLVDLTTGERRLLASDESYRHLPTWSPDGTRLAYAINRRVRAEGSAEESALAIRELARDDERVITPFRDTERGFAVPWDWSPTGEALLVGSNVLTPPNFSLYLLPPIQEPGGENENAFSPVASDARYHLWQGQFSPDGRWLAFVAQSLAEAGRARIAVAARETPGRWRFVTEAQGWADKPRWSPDGNSLYYVTDARGFFNMWAVRFDRTSGRRIGEPFQVTHFESPSFQYYPELGYGEPSISHDTLIVPILEVSGSIWMLDDLNK